MRLILIAVFGLIGVFARYGVDIVTARLGVHAHWGTLAINLVGSFFVTLIYVLGAERGAISTDLRTALLVGLMGGFTTFSSYSLQSALLVEAGNPLPSVVYILLSPAAGVVTAILGLHLFRAV